MSNRPEPGTIAAGRQTYEDRHGKTAVADREFDGEVVADDPFERGAAAHAARRGNLAARCALSFEPADTPSSVAVADTL